MRRQTFAGIGFEKYRKKTRKEQFLAEMDRIIPWQELTAVIEPHYPNYPSKYGYSISQINYLSPRQLICLAAPLTRELFLQMPFNR